jgi:hypothetical protein
MPLPWFCLRNEEVVFRSFSNFFGSRIPHRRDEKRSG